MALPSQRVQQYGGMLEGKHQRFRGSIPVFPQPEEKQKAAQQFSKLQAAMKVLAISPEEQKACWLILASIYHLGAAGATKGNGQPVLLSRMPLRSLSMCVVHFLSHTLSCYQTTFCPMHTWACTLSQFSTSELKARETSLPMII